MKVLFLCVVLVGATRSPAAAPHSARAGSCVARIRDATAGDVLVRERNPLLGAPENANDAPGPGSLRAVVDNDSLHHPWIFVWDTATKTRRRVCPGSLPRFSPDGRWIALSHWVSQERPYVLGLVDVASGRVRLVEGIGQIENYAWSTDARRLAYVSSPYRATWATDVGWIDVATLTPHALATDSVSYVEYGDCEWAPDGERFLATRHREYEHDESLYAEDLWLFDVHAGACRLTRTPRANEDMPGWIDDRHIRYQDDASSKGGEAGARHVIELSPSTRHP
jgi:WD40-like Beta Propeller Repeat